MVNLPVEFNASARAKAQLVSLGIINEEELRYVSKVLNAAALTYVAATLQAILTLLYYLMLVTRQQEPGLKKHGRHGQNPSAHDARRRATNHERAAKGTFAARGKRQPRTSLPPA